jgi:eukaryotic-like serine/threonine-protein kinase
MTLAVGTTLGRYEIRSQIGAGGMGEVYLARDQKLNRDVAIKVLPAALSQDGDRLRRFEQEAQAAGALNHPNILAVYDVGMHDGAPYIVSELLEGEELREQLNDGSLPQRKALDYAQQIAQGLAAAHDRGITHRDLKPENLFVTTDGRVKILDFGLAKLRAQRNETVSSEIDTRKHITDPGTVMGTVGYMSPEQVRGHQADHRSDTFSFGSILYEMLSGQRAFKRDTMAETMTAILKEEPPDLNETNSRINPQLEKIVQRCLEKKPERRFQSASDLAFALAALSMPSSSGANRTAAAQALDTLTTSQRSGLGDHVWMIAFAVAVLGMVAMMVPAVRHLRETPPPLPPETRTDIVTPATDQPTMFALSPDGRQIVFVASSGDGPSRLWLRSLAMTTAQPLALTEEAKYPFWAPDGRSIGFFAGGALKRLDFGGGTPRTLAPALNGSGGTWNSEGVIVFAPNFNNPLMRVSATGGAATAVTSSGPQRGVSAPYFLPDGRRFLFYVFGEPDTAAIYLGTLDGSAPVRLTLANSSGVYLPSGWLLWVRTDTLVAQRLDMAKATLTGETVTLAYGVTVDAAFGQSAVSVASTGLVAYRTGTGSERQLTWVDRSGTRQGTVGEPDGSISEARVSPDGRRVVVVRTVDGNTDLWLLDGPRMSRFTFDPTPDDRPVWSPDSTRIVFRSRRDLYQKGASGAGVDERLLDSDQSKVPTSWSADGRFLLYESIDPQTNADLWIVPIVGDHTPSVFLKTAFREAKPAFSPDGRWVAYHSNKSGRNEIYVRPFVPPASPGAPIETASEQQVSIAGGIHTVWRHDGKELYYLNPAGAMMAVLINVTGTTLQPGAPVVLFPTRILGGGVDAQHGRQYDVAPDGRFLINTVLDSAPAPITLLMNWNPEVKK